MHGAQFSTSGDDDPYFWDSGMFRFCFFKGEDCNLEKLWHKSMLPNFGNCYTFNAAYNEEDAAAPRNVSLTGSTNGA